VGPVPSNIVDGTRVNTAMAYLSHARERPNLEILGDTHVLRVRIDNGKAVGVETLFGFIAADEVILAAGAVASPHILMHSGIGPADQLEAHGITSIADLPVGQDFSDHPNLAVGWHSSMPLSNPQESFAFPTALNFNSSGFHNEYSDGDLEILLAVKPTSTLFGNRPTSWSDSGRDEYQLLVSLQQPKARGRMKLVSNDPLVQPRIDYNYLQDDSDRARMRIGVRTAVAILHASPFRATFIEFSTLNDAVLANDERLDEWIEAHLSTAIHLSGSAPIGDVVDWQGRVHGMDSLRVADTSILPTVPSRGTFNTAVFIGEFIAHQIMQVDATRNL
jgi:choline dehydrogenase-like flavoprotein